MAKMVLVTLPDDVHELLKQIKSRKGFPNNAEALAWIIKRAAGVEDPKIGVTKGNNPKVNREA